MTSNSKATTAQVDRDAKSLPIIDISPLIRQNSSDESLNQTVQEIREACRNWGFFYIVNHGVSLHLQEQVEVQAKKFFALPLSQKNEISISNSGRSWRGYFSMGIEKTENQPDMKEGINFGVEHSPDDPRVLEGLPLHGPNLWPSTVPELKPVYTEYMAKMEQLGYSIMKGIALSLNLPADYFEVNYLKDPTIRCIVLNYPPDVKTKEADHERWGVDKHSDYGLLTMLKQDNSGGLQVQSVHHGWIEAKPIENSFICNIGDMLQTVTNGFYRSTPHRVQNIFTGKNRFSCPVFLDPSWDAEIKPLPPQYTQGKKNEQTANCYIGSYGDYATMKFSKNFPDTKTIKPLVHHTSQALKLAKRLF